MDGHYGDALAKIIRIEVSKYQLLKQRVLSEYPNIDEDSLADTLEGSPISTG